MLNLKEEGEILILDYDSALESFLNGLIVAGLVGFVLSLSEGWLWGVLTALLASAVFCWLRYGLDVHLQVDRERREIWLQRNFWGFQQRRLLANFSQFECLTASGRRHEYGQWPWQPVKWEMACVLVLKNGKILRLSDYATDEEGDELGQLARQLQVPLVSLADLGKRRLRLQRRGGRVQVTHLGPLPDPYILTFCLTILLAFSWSAYVVLSWN